MNRTGLSESFNKAAQTLEESTDSARKMLKSLQQDGKLLIAPRKIGCGLAGGDKDKVLQMIEESLAGMDVTIVEFNKG